MAKIYDFNREKFRRLTKWGITSNGQVFARLPYVKLDNNIEAKWTPIDMSMFDNEDEVHIIHRHK